MLEQEICLEIKKACELTFKYKYNIKDEDIAYDAMASIMLQYLKNKANILSFKPWLYGAIHHHYSLFVRNKKRDSIFVFDQVIVDSYENHEYPKAKIDMEYINIRIKELESPYKEILSLRLIDQLSHKDIAENLKLNQSTVRKYYSRAIEKLGKKIKQNISTILTKLIFVDTN